MEDVLSKLAVMLVPALLAIMLHEVSHGFVAERFGDPTARLLGRLNLNPFKHLDPVGSIAVFVFGFGWAKPVPVNPSNFRRPRKDMVWVALAGPLTNLMLALFSAVLLRLLAWFEPASSGDGSLLLQMLTPLNMMVAFSLYINVLLAVFNLLPVPPLDGGRILMGFVPDFYAALLSRLEPFGLILIVLLVFFTNLWSTVLAPIVHFLVIMMAGKQMALVEQAMRFLFGH